MASLPLVSPFEGENFLNPFHTQSPGLRLMAPYRAFPSVIHDWGRGLGQLGLPTPSGHFDRIHVGHICGPGSRCPPQRHLEKHFF